MQTVSALTAENIHVTYGANTVLHGVDLQVPTGQCLAIMGQNGSGKSTFVKAIVGAAPVSAGTFQILGQPQENAPWDKLGYVPQRVSAPAGVSSTALEVVRSGTLGPRRWWYRPGTKGAALKALDVVGLAHRKDQAFHLLSGGQQQRILIARALVRDPQILIMDEPLSGIDHHSARELARVVKHLKSQGRTIIIVLHELGPMEPLLDRIVTVANGHIETDRKLQAGEK
ncbi:MAG: metal ABC transporter ATP-binding protein [Actinomycetaceae bacterium]|nr:metal ABC transporter ATP-binding protein [Actinomycetaceae bacterium]